MSGSGRSIKIPDGIEPTTWPMWVLWNDGLLPLRDFDHVSIDDVDLAMRAYIAIRRTER